MNVPCHEIEGRGVVLNGRWLKVAAIRGEHWLEEEPVRNLPSFLTALKSGILSADLFVFAQPFSTPSPRHGGCHMEWDNVAVISLTTFEDWWRALSQESRRNVRTASKRGVRVEVVAFDEKLVQGIKGIYDETPIRQGRPFWHYGKGLETVRGENATYLERSTFLAAYLQDELVGFIKMVRVGNAYSIMQILGMNRHFDKRPAHALIAKAVEIACSLGATQLVYCSYVYGNKEGSSITEFKRRLGFVQVNYPRYYIPLTWKGSIAVALGLHRSVRELLPGRLLDVLLILRERYYGWRLKGKLSGGPQSGSSSNSAGGGRLDQAA